MTKINDHPVAHSLHSRIDSCAAISQLLDLSWQYKTRLEEVIAVTTEGEQS